MRRLLLAALLVNACGGGEPAPDQDAVSACLEWSYEVCRLARACVLPPDRDDEIRARFGETADDCDAKLAKLCRTNQTGDVFGPSCGPGKVVDHNALDACVSDIYNVPCSAWTPDVGDCRDVCVGG
jgi:hypothetical protein